MARALITQAPSDPTEVAGLSFTLTLTVMFYGSDVPIQSGRDWTTCSVTITDTMTKDDARAAIRDAITAEAARLEYSYDGEVIYLSELFVGL